MKHGEMSLIHILASNDYVCYRNFFQNGVDALLKIIDAFLSKKLQILRSSGDPIMFNFF